MKCFGEYARAQQLLAEYARLLVATAMVDEKWKEIRPLLDMENRRDLRYLALSCHWNALGSRSAELFWTDLRGAWRCAGLDGACRVKCKSAQKRPRGLYTGFS